MKRFTGDANVWIQMCCALCCVYVYAYTYTDMANLYERMYMYIRMR